jgi:hypothetical protein
MFIGNMVPLGWPVKKGGDYRRSWLANFRSLLLRRFLAAFLFYPFCLFGFGMLLLGAIPMVVMKTLLLAALLPNMVSSFTDQIVFVSHLVYSC